MPTCSHRLLVCAWIAAAAPAVAQCSVVALPNAFPANQVLASAPWDPDGSGPLPVQLALAGDIAGSPVAVLDPATSLVTPLPSPGFTPRALAVLPNGELVAGGYTLFMGVQQRAELARWNGTAWTAMVSSSTSVDIGTIEALAVLPNGDLIVGGSFFQLAGLAASSIARWDGATWHTLGPTFWAYNVWIPGGVNGPVSSLIVEPSGDLLVGGSFTAAGGLIALRVARWDGVAWHVLGSGVDNGVNGGVYSMVKRANGDLVVGGSFTQAASAPAPFAARWDGTAWHAMGQLNGEILRLVALPNGDLAAAGSFSLPGGGCLGRWDGTSWSALAGGAPGTVGALVALPSGDLLATAAGSFQPSLLTLRTTCPAATASFGTGCAGAGGVNELRADTLPWTGGTFRCTATGMPGTALVLCVYSFTQLAVPMSSVLPQGLPGCTIHMTPDLVDVQLPLAGTVQTSLPLPNQPALAGIVFHHYVVPFEVDPTFNIVAVTSSNALSMTVGSW